MAKAKRSSVQASDDSEASKLTSVPAGDSEGNESEAVYHAGMDAGESATGKLGELRALQSQLVESYKSERSKLTVAIAALTSQLDRLDTDAAAMGIDTNGNAPAKRRGGRPAGSRNKAAKPARSRRAAQDVSESQILKACASKGLTDGQIAKALEVSPADVAPVRKALLAAGKLKNTGGHGRGTLYKAA